MKKSYQFIIHSKSEDSTIHMITINREKKRNAISFETMEEIDQCIQNYVNPYSSLARVLLLKSAGTFAFTAGLDRDSAAQVG